MTDSFVIGLGVGIMLVIGVNIVTQLRRIADGLWRLK